MATFEIASPDGATYQVDAPDEVAAAGVVRKMLGGSLDRGSKPPASFAERFGDGPMARDDGRSGALADALQREADTRLVGEPGLGNQAAAAILNAGNAVGLNLPRNIAAGLATAAGAVGVPGYEPRSFSQNYDLAKDQEAALSRQYPKTALAGTASGIVGGALALPALSGAATMTGRAAQAGATAGGYSAASEALDTKDPTRAAVAGGLGMMAGAALQPVVEKAAPHVLRAAELLTPWLQKGGALRTSDGALTTTSRALLKRAGIDPATVDAELDQAIRVAIAAKGETPDVVREAVAKRYGIDLTRGQAADDYGAQQAEALMARGGDEDANKLLRGFFDRQREQVAGAKEDIGRRLAGGEAVVDNPYGAGEMVANRAAQTYRLARQVEGGALRQAEETLAQLKGQDPIDAVDAGAAVADAVRGRAAQAKADYQAKYGDALSREGQFSPEAVRDLPSSIARSLENRAEPVIVDQQLTPAAARALDTLKSIRSLKLGARGTGDATPAATPARAGGLEDRIATFERFPAALDEGAVGTAGSAAKLSVGDAIFTPSGRRVPVEYRVVDASALKGSHTPDLRPNPAYPAELQPRDRTRAASETQVLAIARDLQPERLGPSASAMEGAPVVGPDGLIESGNARFLGIRRAYQENGPAAQRYRDYLEQQGYDTRGIAEPVLVRVRKSDMAPEERVRFAQESNASPGLAVSASERAATDAQRLPPEVLSLYRGGDVGDAANRDFVRGFVRNVADRGEEGAFVTRDGALSLEGAQRVRNALLQSAYGDSGLVARLAETGDENVRAFGNLLSDVAGDVARLRQAVAADEVVPGADLSKPLLEAAQVVAAARQRGVPLSAALAQRDAFGRISAEADGVLRLVYGPDLAGRLNRARAADALRGAVSDASQQPSGARLFGEPLTARDILAARTPVADAAPAGASKGVQLGQPSAEPERMTAAQFREWQAAQNAPKGSKAGAAEFLLAEPIDLQGVDLARKKLVSFYKAAKSSGNASDVRAVGAILEEFDNRVERAMADGLFSGDPGALDALKAARKSFADYQRTFKPQGAGDDVGRAMQRIIERDAQPTEVANFLYGSGKLGQTGLSLRLADRLKRTLGADSPEWAAVQQGYIARVISGSDTSHAAIGKRIGEALSGEGRDLASRVLTDEQMAGLRSFQTAVNLAQRARERVPDWLNDLAKGGFEPQKVLDELYGRATVGGKSTSAEFARALRGYLGTGSPEWAALRQAGWQKLTSKVEGSTDDYGSQAMANRIASFLNGPGKSLAGVLYSAEERAAMAEFGKVMGWLVPKRVAGGSASPNSDTAPALASMAQRLSRNGNRIAAMLGMGGMMHGGIGGAVAGFSMGRALGGLADKLTNRAQLRQAQQAIAGAPILPPPPPLAPDLRPLSVGTGLALGTAY